MSDNLFAKQPQYTIDSCALMAIFNNEPWVSKDANPGLWRRIEALVLEGIIISHAEVLAEIKKDGKKGEALYAWAHTHETIFQPHRENVEGDIIRAMSVKYKVFVANKGDRSSSYADPWLIAQAKSRKLKIISQEKLSGSLTSQNMDCEMCAMIQSLA